MAVSPLAPATYPALIPISGVRLSAVNASIRYKQPRLDLMLALLDEGTHVAGVFTRSLTASAPVERCRYALQLGGGKARALVVNSGNSNAFTGKAGEKAVTETIAATCEAIGCKPEEVFVASTGVIGEPLPYDKIVDAMPALVAQAHENGWLDVSRAILTTDTFPKMATRTYYVDGVKMTINGFAKGSGMIAPNMGTMLAFLFTDAAVEPDALQSMLKKANDCSFNSITVDSDTSTSDTALLFATGEAGNAPIAEENADFQEALNAVMVELAQMIVKDGEGASRFIQVEVTGAESPEAARKIGLSIGNSPLVKTAVAGGDPNWGRIVMAVGKSGERADRDKLSIWIGDALIAKDGQINPDYKEPLTAEYMKGQYITIRVDVGVGEDSSTIWTCDLTSRYVEINADYRS